MSVMGMSILNITICQSSLIYAVNMLDIDVGINIHQVFLLLDKPVCYSRGI